MSKSSAPPTQASSLMCGMQDFNLSKQPGTADSASSGQGTGLRAQRRRKSLAYREGRTMRLAWRSPGARPAVTVSCEPLLQACRTSWAVVSGESDASFGGSTIVVVVAIVDLANDGCEGEVQFRRCYVSASLPSSRISKRLLSNGRRAH